MKLTEKTPKEVGAYGENTACEYLKRKGYKIVARNVARNTGEIDIIARKGETLHFVEVKSLLCREFPESKGVKDEYSPSANLHRAKINKVARTAEWYVAENEWEGDWQVDGLLVWLRERDGDALVEHLPQIV